MKVILVSRQERIKIITTTETRAKEVRSLAENLIALAIKEKDNFEMVEQKVVKAKCK